MDNTPAIVWITGPPASGKSTLCAALASRFQRAIHIPVDDVRTWVVSGLSESVPWTQETERQFRIAESAVCEVAKCYQASGFHVIVDHCRNLPTLEEVLSAKLVGAPTVKVCLMPDLEANLHRSHTRTNKSFDKHMLDETIRFTNTNYRNHVPNGWLLIDNTHLSVEDTVLVVLSEIDTVIQGLKR